MSLKRRFYHSLSVLSPAIIETLLEKLEQEETQQLHELYDWTPPTDPREFWEMDPVTGEWRLIGE